jgi:hypothetical protein
MNSQPLKQNWSHALRYACASGLLLSCTLGVADTTAETLSRDMSEAEPEKAAASQTSPNKERIFLPESAFVKTDPNAPLPKLSAPMRPTARAVEPEVSVITQTKSRVRPAAETAGSSTINHAGNANQVTEVNRVELKRNLKPTANQDTQVIEKAPTLSVLPEPKLMPSAPPSMPTQASELAPPKHSRSVNYKTTMKQAPSGPLINTKATVDLPAVERLDRRRHEAIVQAAPTTSVSDASSTQDRDDLLAATNSLAESTARIRAIEKTIDDMQRMLSSTKDAQSSPLLLAALPYASVTAQNTPEKDALSQQSNWSSNDQANNAIARFETTARATNKNQALGQWGLLQLILVSVLAGIAGYLLLNRRRLRN